MLKKFLLSFAAGVTALSLGLGIFYAGEFLFAFFQTSETETVEARAIETVVPKTIPVEELIYPKASVQIETTEQEKENKEEEFDPTGYYYLIGGTGDLFQGFDEFHIDVLNYENDPKTNRRVTSSTIPEGYMDNEAEEELKFVRLFISEKHIAFETERKNGISYRFEGNFIDQKDVEYKGETYYANVEGVLIKLKNGKEIIRRNVLYTHYIGC